MKMDDILKDIIKNKKTCYFVSPHLDDAAFSAGGLISYLAKKTKVYVITAFTEAGIDKHSLSAIAYVRKCGFNVSEIKKFFTLRKKEDKELFENLGVNSIHLGFYDALWRKKKNLSIVERVLSFILSDFRYIYPTHRLHAGKGKIFDSDLLNLENLQKRLKETIGSGKDKYVFCPIGLGNHVDHIMVKTACTKTFENVLYWEDAPYNLYNKTDQFLAKRDGLVSAVFSKNQTERKSMYPAYKTQFGKLFGGREDFDLPLEKYYLSEPGVNKKNTRNTRRSTVTVGIPAYDEEANIGELLKVLFRQKKDNFNLNEIIVVSDGSNDNTEAIVESFKERRVRLFKNEHRQGQNSSQNLIVSETESDYLLLLEADILPETEYYISKLVSFAQEKSADVVQGLPKPLTPKTFVESVLIKQGLLFSEYFLKDKVNPANHISGQGGRLLSKRVYKKLFWPDYVSEDLYLMCYCSQRGFKYVLDKESICFCRYPGNIPDFIRKRRKVIAGMNNLNNYFSLENTEIFRSVFTKDSIAIFFEFLVADPIRFLSYIFIKVYVQYKLREYFNTKAYYYAESTKHLVR
jgi:glycosyltransferase involved in cell wall biosynthesis